MLAPTTNYISDSHGAIELLNFFLKIGIKANVKVLIRSYLDLKEQRPDSNEQELLALILESRHSYERDANNALLFNYKNLTIDVSRLESIGDLAAWVISAEKRGLRLSAERQTKFNSILDRTIQEELKARGIQAS